MAKQKSPIRGRLDGYSNLQRRIEMQEERLKKLQSTLHVPASQRFTGMPHGGGEADKIGRRLESIEALEDKIQAMKVEEQLERSRLEHLVDRLLRPEEQLVLQLKYFDLIEWPDVCMCIFGSRDDYLENEESYLRTTYRLHGAALQHLAEEME